MKTDALEPVEIRKSRETELQRENARLRGDLLTIAQRISHDLRTPLGSISMTAEMLKELLQDGSPVDAAMVAPIFDSTEESIKLIERVSFLVKASIKPLPSEPVAMGDVVHLVLDKLHRKIVQSGAAISKPEAWPEVAGVPAWLRVIWLNLLTNSLQSGGESLKLELGWKMEKDHARFWVCDNAGGVPPEKRKKLFQPFETLSEPDAAPGLGLSIVQRLVSLQQGRCGYEPHNENGSLFYFTLPVSDE
jgi:signal transduction histidine kinase